MRVTDVLKDAARSIRANKLRTALSILGIVIGVGSVIALVSVGTGAQRQVTEQIASLGSNLINVSPGRQFGRGGRSFGSANVMRISLAEEMESAAPAIKRVIPQHQSSAQLVYGQNHMRVNVMGVTDAYPDMMNYPLLVGRFVRPGDVDDQEAVIVLGSAVATTLFESELPIGQTVIMSIGQRRIAFRVIGVMAPKGQVMFTNYDNLAYVPVTTLLHKVTGGSIVNGFIAEAVSAAHIQEGISQLEYFLTRRLGDPNSFQVSNQQSLLDTLSSTIGTFSVMLGAIAGISLIVGGIGIMNIMLVSVSERTKEIGLRKALGALRRDLLAQFLTEAVVLSVSGGIIGVILGWAGAQAIERFGGIPAAVSMPAVALSIGFSMAVGLIFGVYPALRAASLDPVVALRYE